MALRAVIFDFDGVLVNSEPLHFQALRDCLLPEGVAIDEQEYERYYLAFDDREAIRAALERHGAHGDAERIGRLASRKALLFDALLPEIPVFPGAVQLVRALFREYPLAIASGALRREIEMILSLAGLRDAFGVIVAADDVQRCKPDPAPFLAAMQGLASRTPNLAPSECLAVEDSMAGIASARAAGMKVLGIAHSYPADRLSTAHLVAASLQDINLDLLRSLFVEV
jgi:beta-phosphoglucomutase